MNNLTNYLFPFSLKKNNEKPIVSLCQNALIQVGSSHTSFHWCYSDTEVSKVTSNLLFH